MGSRSLSTTTYKNDRSSLVSRFDYGNGAYRTYTYDSFDRVIGESVNGTQALSYLYDKNNLTAQTTDYLSGITTKFYYDLIGRITEVTTSNGMQIGYSYDSGKNRLKGYTVKLPSASSFAYTYRYGTKDTDEPIVDAVYGVLLNGTEQIGYKYDDLGRLQSRTLVNGYVTEYDYLEGWAAGTTTTLVKTVKNGEDTLEYTYDNLGNIQSISKNGELQESYTYDALGQLTGVTDADGNVTGYTYDDGGNILSVEKNGETVKSYTYGDSEWKDLLTGFNGQAITYDEIGNPLQYRDGMNFTWQNGRQLAEILQNGEALASYTYDAGGLRTSKTVDGVTTDYYWLNGVLQAQKTGDEYIIFLYDENGSAYGFLVKNGSSEAYYYYVYNAQGDVIGLLDSAGERVVEYTYGAWGEITSVTGTLAGTIGKQNPLRYRGYYYDEETGFYYLQSRYYDPVTQRFLNADSLVAGTSSSVEGYNLFAYCFNDPVNLTDDSGNWPSLKNIVKKIVSKVIDPIEKTIEKIWKKTVKGTTSTGVTISGAIVVGGNASVGRYTTKTNAPDIESLRGPSEQAGGSVGIEFVSLGAEWVFFRNPENTKQYYGITETIGYGFELPIPLEFHGELNKTAVYYINIFEQYRRFYDAVMGW